MDMKVVEQNMFSSIFTEGATIAASLPSCFQQAGLTSCPAHLLRFKGFAVCKYSGTFCALHLRRTCRVNHSGRGA